MSEFWNEFIAGTIAGFAQVFIGQPFDIVKVRMQTSQNSENPLSIFRTIMKKEGLLAFWKGSSSPLLGVGAAVAIQFGVNENAKKMFHSPGKGELKWTELSICGALAGVANAFVAIPTEHIRIRMQSSTSSSSLKTTEIAKQIYRTSGIKGLFHGTRITMLRESIGSKRNESEQAHGRNYLNIGLAGGLSGLAYWLSCYPIDVVKTVIQSGDYIKPQYKGIIDCSIAIVKSNGIKGLFRGFTPCVLRSIPTNGGTFIVYETIIRQIKQNQM